MFVAFFLVVAYLGFADAGSRLLDPVPTPERASTFVEPMPPAMPIPPQPI